MDILPGGGSQGSFGEHSGAVPVGETRVDADLLTGPVMPAPENKPVRWRTAALVAAAVAVVGGGGALVVQQVHKPDTATVSLDYLAAAQAKTSAENDFHLQMKMSISMSGRNITVDMGGEMSQRPTRFEMSVDLPQFGRLEERAIDHTLYVHTDHTDIGGKHWLGYTFNTGSTSVLGGSDPLSTLQQLSGATGKITRKGDKTVDGVRTVHYAAKLDLTQAVDKLPSDLQQVVQSNNDLLQSLNDVPVDVYIAPDGTVRRMVERMTIEGMKMTVQLDLTPLGHPVHAVAPPASDVSTVRTFSELFQELTTGGIG